MEDRADQHKDGEDRSGINENCREARPGQQCGDHSQLGRTWDGKLQDGSRNGFLALAPEQARRDGRHGHTAEAEDQGNDRAAVEADGIQAPVHQCREAGQIAAILHDGEGKVKRDHQRQQEEKQIGDRHGQHAELPYQDHPEPGVRSDVAFNDSPDPRLPQSVAEGWLHKIDKVLGHEGPDEEVDQVEGAEQYRDAGPGVHRQAADAGRDASPDILLGEDGIDDQVDPVPAFDVQLFALVPRLDAVACRNNLIPLQDQGRFRFGSGNAQHGVQLPVQGGVLFSFPRLFDRGVELIESHLRGGGRLKDRNSQVTGEELGIDFQSDLLHFVHEVQDYDDVLPHIDELLGEEQVAFEMDCVDNV